MFPICCDSVGNLMRDDMWTYAWEHGRELMRMTGSGKTITFEYNADGLRVSKTVDGVVHNYVYSGGKLVQETYGDTKLDFSYDAYGNPYTFTYTKSSNVPLVYHYVLNLQGDVVRLVTDDGITVATYAYDAWGNVLSMSGSLLSSLGCLNPLLYRGYVFDMETKLYYIQSRYYNPEIGRFINADGAYDTSQGIMGHNMYAYCLNNPINMHDPNGRCGRFLWILWKVDCGKASCPDSKNYVKPKAIDPIGFYNNGRGSVYVVTEDQLDIMSDRESNVVVIVDKRSDSDPDMQILESYKITRKKQQKEIIQLMLDYNTENPVNPAWSRTKASLLEEWTLHNFAYSWGIAPHRTADCDFNNADEGKGFWDFLTGGSYGSIF